MLASRIALRTLDDSRRNAGHRAACRYRLSDDCVRADYGTVTNLDVTEQHAAAPQKHTITNPRHALTGNIPPPPGRANGHMLEESAIPTHNSFRVNDAPQTRVVEDARRIYLCADTNVATEKHPVELPQEVSRSVSSLAKTAKPIGKQRNLQVSFIRHG